MDTAEQYEDAPDTVDTPESERIPWTPTGDTLAITLAMYDDDGDPVEHPARLHGFTREGEHVYLLPGQKPSSASPKFSTFVERLAYLEADEAAEFIARPSWLPGLPGKKPKHTKPTVQAHAIGTTDDGRTVRVSAVAVRQITDAGSPVADTTTDGSWVWTLRGREHRGSGGAGKPKKVTTDDPFA